MATIIFGQGDTQPDNPETVSIGGVKIMGRIKLPEVHREPRYEPKCDECGCKIVQCRCYDDIYDACLG